MALESIYLLVDRMIDAYARAVALTGVEPPKVAPSNGLRISTGRDPAEWMEDLTALYTFRHKGSLAGLKELIATVLSRPVPAEPTMMATRP